MYLINGNDQWEFTISYGLEVTIEVFSLFIYVFNISTSNLVGIRCFSFSIDINKWESKFFNEIFTEWY